MTIKDAQSDLEDVSHLACKPAGWIVFNAWLDKIEVSRTTGWRWRRSGWVKTTNINGRQYVSSEAIAEFSRRADAGEFAKKHTVPHVQERSK